MELSVINIENSKEVLFSKTILERDYIILNPIAEIRRGWEKAFKKNARK